MTDNFVYHFVHYKILLIIVKYLKSKLSFKAQNVYIFVLFGGEILRIYINHCILVRDVVKPMCLLYW
jgi:hypothetical protein